MKRWTPFILFLLFVATVIVCADSGHIRAFLAFVNSIPFADKFGHLILIGTLAFLLNYALGGRMVKIGAWWFLVGGIFIAVAMTGEEFSQRWFPTRTFDLGDLSANYIGIFCGGLPWRLKKLRERNA